ncbi:MAG: hypothetical protein GYB64_07050 [Chloroflexi bacterium]|nr:hypothetical protein [Chloroflexota bacterium]
MSEPEEKRPTLLLIAGPPLGLAVVGSILISVAAGWPAGQIPGLAAAIFLVTLVPWLVYTRLRQLSK